MLRMQQDPLPLPHQGKRWGHRDEGRGDYSTQTNLRPSDICRVCHWIHVSRWTPWAPPLHRGSGTIAGSLQGTVVQENPGTAAGAVCSQVRQHNRAFAPPFLLTDAVKVTFIVLHSSGSAKDLLPIATVNPTHSSHVSLR